MISDEQKNTNTKKSLMSIYQANDQSKVTTLFVYLMVVLSWCVRLIKNQCMYFYYKKWKPASLQPL